MAFSVIMKSIPVVATAAAAAAVVWWKFLRDTPSADVIARGSSRHGDTNAVECSAIEDEIGNFRSRRPRPRPRRSTLAAGVESGVTAAVAWCESWRASSSSSSSSSSSPSADFLPRGPSSRLRHAVDALWRDATGRPAVAVDPALTDRTNRLLRRLISAIPSAGCHFLFNDLRLVLVDDADLYAYTDPCRDVLVVSSGMARLLDDDQLMIVLGHELAHTMIPDRGRMLPTIANISLARMWEHGYRTARWRIRALLVFVALNYVWNVATDAAASWVPPKIMVALACALVAIEASHATVKAWRNECLADWIAFRLAVVAGADPSAGWKLLERPEIRRADGARAWFSRFTHPSVDHRAGQMHWYDRRFKWLLLRFGSGELQRPRPPTPEELQRPRPPTPEELQRQRRRLVTRSR